MGTKNPIQSVSAVLPCLSDDLIPGDIQKITPSAIAPNKTFSHNENSINLLQQF